MKITENIKINGCQKLSGEIVTNTSKNGALALIATSLLNHGITKLHGIPKNEEVLRLIEVIVSLGVEVKWLKHKRKSEARNDILEIKRPAKLNLQNLDKINFSKIRVGLYLIPILLYENESISLPNPGGCKMGERTISAHSYALETFGISIKSEETEYKIKKVKENKLSKREIVMYESSDTGSINALLMSAKTLGNTTIMFAPPNYQVQDVCVALNKMGVNIKGIGTTTLIVTGMKEINMDLDLYNSEDPIESMLFISAALMTDSKLIIKRCPIDFLRLELLKLEKMGMKYKKSEIYLSVNSYTKLLDITILPSKLVAPKDKIHPSSYPGLNVDNLPFFAAIAAKAKGATLVHDWMWENRAIYFTELCKLGADVRLADPHRVFITGVSKLKAGNIICPPALRPGSIILVAMMGAEGISTLQNIYSINRGYENLVQRLNAIGADIKYI